VDRTFWDFGAKFQLGGTSWSHLVLDLRWSDTNLNKEQFGNIDWCDPSLMATLQVNFWPRQ